MHITIAVPGRFHAFYLAERLLSQGVQCRLITTYPKYAVTKYGVPREAIVSESSVELLQRLYQKLPRFISSRINAEFFFAQMFDRLALKRLGSTDICIGWSGFSLQLFEKARSAGAKTILERGSTHIEFQQEIVKEEFERMGLVFSGAHPGIVDKEMREYDYADYIEVPSAFARQTFIDRGFPASKLIQGFRGVDIAEFRPLPRQDGVFRVVFAGAISPRKGVHYLLEAFKKADLAGAELLLIGSIQDEMRSTLRKYSGSFKLVNHVSQDRLRHYYSQGSVFVMPSIEEGMAVVQLQAMACGLPLICTTNTGGADIIREGQEGYVVPVRDVNALRERMAYLYENRAQCQRMGQAARDRVAASFTWDHYMRHMLKIYQEIINEKEKKSV
jgi:glycosyltransferase involved in cell wall biosynthesis